MAKNPTKIPISDLKQDASATLKRVRKSKRPLIVTQRGKPAAVLLSMDAYKRASKNVRSKLLALGERDRRWQGI